MPIKISYVIESKLRFLKLTRAGKIRLSVFSDKVLYHAINKLQRTYSNTPKNPFNTYFSLCLLETQRLQLQPSWDAMNDFPYFDIDGAVTLNDEMFDMKKCHDITHDLGKQKKKPKYHSTNTRQSAHGPTFSEGLSYWKYGKEYPYPDQGIGDDTNPTKKDPTYVPPLKQSDPSRFNLSQKDELKKAVQSGKISKKGLAFLRNTFLNKPELLNIIDAHLNNQASPTDDQETIPF